MYLTIKQQDAFRNLLMGFEIPYRSFIAKRIIDTYSTDVGFESAMNTKYSLLSPASPKFLRETLNKKKTRDRLKNTYQLFQTARTSVATIVTTDIDLPVVGALNLVTFALTEDFRDLYGLFSSYNLFCKLAEDYRYARNKLDHPGSRTLEESHMVPVLSFVYDICQFLDSKYFLQKSKDLLIAEVVALQQRRMSIPIEKHNFADMPFGESRLVCRDLEIDRIKEFVYGKPESLRKQHACCIYGYGGVGKTALVLESLKQVVGDLMDGITINGYNPEYIYFFSAKKRKLSYAAETGKLIEQRMRCNFETADELINLILSSLKVDNLKGFHGEGLIVVDNLETLSAVEKEKVKVFIDTQTPSEMQFIVTSRNSEEYEVPFKLAGFEGGSGNSFIQSYNEENSLGLNLTEEEMGELLYLSKGNTLVLVLCLRRLSEQLITIGNLKVEFSSRNVWKVLKSNLSGIPSGAFEVIAEFMYKDTFEQIEETFSDNADLFYKVLKIFAIIDNGSTDVNTICLLTKEAYPDVEAVVDILCNYLILEKNDTEYTLNSFVDKYIVGRFMPDSETYNQLSTEIARQMNQVRNELEQMEADMQSNPRMASIMNDWQIHTDIDRITAAKVYRLFQEVEKECRNDGRRKVGWALEEFEERCNEAERMTAHPFIKNEKARIYELVDRFNILPNKHEKIIRKAFNDCIYAIKTIDQYSGIQQTKSYAALLWIYGQYLSDIKDTQSGIRYLENSRDSFESQKIMDEQYFQCVSKLGAAYLDYFEEDKSNRIAYLRKAREISIMLKNNRMYLGKAHKYAMKLSTRLGVYSQYT